MTTQNTQFQLIGKVVKYCLYHCLNQSVGLSSLPKAGVSYITLDCSGKRYMLAIKSGIGSDAKSMFFRAYEKGYFIRCLYDKKRTVKIQKIDGKMYMIPLIQVSEVYKNVEEVNYELQREQASMMKKIVPTPQVNQMQAPPSSDFQKFNTQGNVYQ